MTSFGCTRFASVFRERTGFPRRLGPFTKSLPDAFSPPLISICSSSSRFRLPFVSRRLFSNSTLSLTTSDHFGENKSEAEEKVEEEEGNDRESFAESDIRNGILEAALDFVPTLGWSREAIVAAAEKYGYPGVAHGMFPGGGADLANYFYSKCNSALRERLSHEARNEILDPSQFIRDALRRRLEMTLEVKETWPGAMSALATPDGVKGALENLYHLVDDVWFYAGDKSVDSDWYMKRAAIASVYKATEFYMLQDESEGHVDTWLFLERRLNEVNTLRSQLDQRGEVVRGAMDSFYGIATTFANIAGVQAK